MPRTRRSPDPVVIPSRALVASAVRYQGSTARIYRPNQDWQREAYRQYAICGEARFAAKFFGQALSRAVLKNMKKTPDGPRDISSPKAVAALDALFSGKDGQAQMLDALGTHLTIAGECYLVGREVEGVDIWEIVSVLEMFVTGNQWSIRYGDGLPPVTLTDKDVVIRIWSPNPGKRIEADSPFRSLLPILTEIEWLTRHIFAQTSSRLAGAGIMFVSQGATFPPPPEKDGQPQQTSNDADAFMLTLADAMLAPITDPSSPSAMVPIVVSVPEAVMANPAKLLHFWTDLDANALKMRQEAVHRFALGMDLPPEQVTGLSSNSGTGGGRSNGVSHWGAWQIEESTIKFHIEPMLEMICNAIVIGYLRPLINDPSEIIVFDSSALRLRPDRSKEAIEMYDRAAISAKVMLRENGFDENDDVMGEEEFQQWLLKKVATGSATPDMVAGALKELGVDIPFVPVPDSGTTTPAPPSPSLEDHPTRPRTPESAALLAASEALVFRALERAGNRIRQVAGVKPPGVKSYEMHTLYCANGQAQEFLSDAWSCAPQVLDGLAEVEPTVQMLDAYCRALMAEQAPHSRDRLAQWLEAGR